DEPERRPAGHLRGCRRGLRRVDGRGRGLDGGADRRHEPHQAGAGRRADDRRGVRRDTGPAGRHGDRAVARRPGRRRQRSAAGDGRGV
ncbi:MAG: hypothetical protein AVDCRST_MAG16-940, partial [uncultured Frankineae bacterium]